MSCFSDSQMCSLSLVSLFLCIMLNEDLYCWYLILNSVSVSPTHIAFLILYSCLCHSSFVFNTLCKAFSIRLSWDQGGRFIPLKNLDSTYEMSRIFAVTARSALPDVFVSLPADRKLSSLQCDVKCCFSVCACLSYLLIASSHVCSVTSSAVSLSAHAYQ